MPFGVAVQKPLTILEHSCLESNEWIFSKAGKKYVIKDFKDAVICCRRFGGVTFSRPWRHCFYQRLCHTTIRDRKVGAYLNDRKDIRNSLSLHRPQEKLRLFAQRLFRRQNEDHEISKTTDIQCADQVHFRGNIRNILLEPVNSHSICPVLRRLIRCVDAFVELGDGRRSINSVR